MENDVWWVDEGIAGQGPRPEFLQSQFKTLAEQAKAYPEVRKALGAQTGAPESYEFGEFANEVELSNPHIQEFLSYAKENRLSQDAVSKAMKTFVDYESSMMPNEEAEAAKLGPDGARTREVLDQWTKNHLSSKAQEVYKAIPKTAEVLSFMDELRQRALSSVSNPPSASINQQSFKPLTEGEVRQEIRNNQEKYLNDPHYRSEISRKLEQVMGTG